MESKNLNLLTPRHSINDSYKAITIEALSPNPKFLSNCNTYLLRGIKKREAGNVFGAIEDFDRAMLAYQALREYKFQPTLNKEQIRNIEITLYEVSSCLHERGLAKCLIGNYSGAVKDFTCAIATEAQCDDYEDGHFVRAGCFLPDGVFPCALHNRAIALQQMGYDAAAQRDNDFNSDFSAVCVWRKGEHPTAHNYRILKKMQTIFAAEPRFKNINELDSDDVVNELVAWAANPLSNITSIARQLGASLVVVMGTRPSVVDSTEFAVDPKQNYVL